MTKKILFSFLAALATCFSYAQTISYQVEIYQLGWEGRSDQSGDPEYTYHVWATDNQVGATETGGQCIYTGNDYGPGASNGFVSCSPGGTLFGSAVGIRSQINVPNTTNSVSIRFEGFEKDCNTTCFYESSCGFLGSLSDDDLAQCNNYSVNFRSSPPCVWNDYPVQSCGTFSYGVRIKWWYEGILGGNIGSNQSFCGSGDPSTLNNTSLATGDPYTTYQWQSSPDGITFTDIPGANSKDYDPPVVTTTTYFRRKATACTSGATAFSNNVVITISSPLATPPIAADQSFCGTFDPVLIGGPASTGTACIVYTWEESADGIIWGTAASNSAALTYDPPVISGASKYYRRRADISCGSGNPAGCASYSNIVTVKSVTPITNNVISGNQTLCDYGDPTLLSGTVPTGGALNTYQWQSSPDGVGSWTDIFGANSQNFDPPPTGTTIYYRRIISSPPCSSTSNVISVQVTPAIIANFIVTNIYQRFCQSGDPAVITASPSGGGTGTFTYVWEISTNGGATWTPAPGVSNGVNYDPGVTSVTTEYRRRVISGVCSLDMTTYAQVLILPLPTIASVSSTNVSCFGGNDATINVVASSVNGNVAFSDNNGVSYQVSGTFSGLTAGSYNVVVQDDSLCSRPYVGNPVIITEPPLLSLATVKQDASCASVFDGKITATPSGGTGPNYSYTLNSGPSQPNNVFSGLSAGTYTIEVTDTKGCKATSTITVGNSYIISANIDSFKNVSCFGGNNGAVYVSLTGGIAPYSYSIDGLIFQSNPFFTGLTSGNYTITLRDSKGCTEYLPVTITQPVQVTVILDSVVNVSCAGAGTGSIYITTQGGTSPYTYLWTNGSTNEDLTNVNAGTYNVAITDSKGCTGNAGATITQPLPLFVTLAQSSNVLCKGDSTGNIDITVSGGVPKYTFVWNTADTTEDLSSLVGGSYSVTVTDANGCQKFLTHTVTEPAQALAVVLTKTDATCNGAADGTATATVTGGTTPYTYLWSNNATTSSISGLVAGAYFVTVQDANGCTLVQSITIAQPNPFVISGTVTDVDCKGQTTGAINVTVTPAGTYTYTWSSPSATGQNPTGLAAGTYTVTVNLTSNPGCTVAKSFTIAEPASTLAINIAGLDSIKCAGSNTGFIDVTSTGGTPSYTYSWTQNGSPYATTEDISNLPAGTYALTVTDAKGCSATLSRTLSQPAQVLAAVVTKTDATCNGAADGTATATVTGGTIPYTYLWSNAATTSNVTGLAAGVYFVTVTDAKGCSLVKNATISQPLPFAVAGTVTDVNCKGQNTGAISVTVNPTGTYTYTWSSPSATGQNPTGLTAGTYTVTVNLTSNPSCTVAKTFTVAEPTSALAINLAGFDSVKCAGSNTGFIDITANGGTPSYSYAWTKNGSAFATTEDLSNLSTGNYIVTVTDSKGCTAQLTQNISNPIPITSSIVKTDLNCHGDQNGTATLTVSGGKAPYTYLWSNFQGSQNITQLSGGLYFVVITDANGCEKRDSVTINEPTQVKLTLVSTNISCFNANDGTIDLTVTGGTPLAGTPKYTYTWSHGPTTEDVTGLSQATYAVTVKDANLCSATASALIVNPPAINSIVIITNPLCNVANGSNNGGAVSVGVSGGTPGYTYQWSSNANGSTTSTASNLTGGVYIVTITDSRLCTKVDSAVVIEPDPIIYNVFTKNVSCKDNKDGFLDITAYGGTQPYSFVWSNGNLTEDVGSLPGGNYTVDITDKNGCTAQGFFNVKEPDSLRVSITKTDATCQGANTGSVHAIVTGGTLQYNYLWSNFSFDSIQNNIPGGTYSVVVTDSNQCKASATAIVNGQPSIMSVTKSVSNPKCFGADNGFVSLSVTGGAQPYVYNWNTTPSQSGNVATTLASGTYIVTITDKSGCSINDTTKLTDPAALVVTANGLNQASCANTNDGIVVVNVVGGRAPFIYQYNGFVQSSDTFRGVGPGVYSVLARDANGCEATTVSTIQALGQITVDLTSDKEVILATQPVQLLATAVSDTFIKQYIWTPLSGGFDYSGCADSTLCNNPIARPHQTTTFVVTAIDERGCSATDTLQIEVSNDKSYFMPTAFTPNADGLNDYFEFDVLGAVSFDVNIWNRWGEKVFSNPNQKNGISQSAANGAWDGTFRGKKVQFDTYTYQIVVKYFDGSTENKAGTITVMQ